MGAVRSSGDGITVDIEVSPRSDKFTVVSYNPWRKRIEVMIKSAPEKGKANREIISEFSGLLEKEVEIISGLRSRHKTLRINSMDRESFIKLLLEKFGINLNDEI